MTAPVDESQTREPESGDTPATPRRRRRRLVRLGVAAGVLVLCLALAWVVLWSPLLAVKTARVVGVDGAGADTVLAVAAVPVGTPLALLDTGAIHSAVLTLPWVAGVEVRRGWPNEVVLAVTPRTPIASVAGTAHVVDAEGVLFDAGVARADLPTVDAQGSGLATATAVLASLPAGILRRVDSVTATTRDDVVLMLRSGAQVRWGSADQAEFKAEVLTALLRHKRDMYDVSAPEFPTTFDG